jgi:hypothetical protein
MRYLLAIAGLLALAAASTPGAVITTELKKPDSLTVGDHLQFAVRINAAKGSLVTPPVTDNGFGAFTVLEWNTDRRELASADSFTFTYILATYKPDTCSIPALTFVVARDSARDTLVTGAIPLKLYSVLPATRPESLDIKDLKPQLAAGKPSLLWLWLLLGLGAAAIAGYYLWRWLQKRRKPVIEPPPPPPYEEALALLRDLELRNLPGRGLIKEHVFELSEIFKRYIGRRFAVNAQEFTTEEVVAWLRDSALARPVRNSADWFFTTTDPVKFAKWLPDDATVARFMHEVRSFLEETKPRPEPVTPAATVDAAVQPADQGKPHGA